MLHWLKDRYDASPAVVRRGVGGMIGLLPAEWRFGRAYAHTRRLIRQTESWPRERLRAYQSTRLQQLVRRAYEHSPYYRRVWTAAGLSPDDIRGLDDLPRLPPIAREDVAENAAEMCAADIPARYRRYITTSGTSGRPLGFYVDTTSSAVDWAFVVAQWERVGYRDGHRRAVLRGRVVGGDAPDGPPREYDPIRREVRLSSYHLTPETAPEYIRLLRELRVDYLHAYPSTALVLAQYVREAGSGWDWGSETAARGAVGVDADGDGGLRGLLLGSENILDAQREFLEGVFGCRAYTWYGHSEKCILAGECEHSRDYHVFPQYGLVEILDEDGQPITEPGVPGRLTGTSLINDGMPMIRYATDDWAEWAEDSPCACGRPYRRIRNVRGRRDQEALVGRSGALFPMAALNLHSAIYTSIRQFQFVQTEPGAAVLRVVPGADFTDAKAEALLTEFRRKVEHDLTLRLERVETIPRTARGKYKFVDQRVRIGTPLIAAEPDRTDANEN